ncbi:MAG: hypothetical protein KZQ71_09440, partial [Candidatus Thiodiazotropha sp. (ex Lucinoma aequizonata)]|nr:hypothetical protein [Candidatus Thiodiazotropha sp. (ex Lucinoma aequizonata)]
NSEADQDDGILRISLDTKATVKVGPFSRGGIGGKGKRPVIMILHPRRHWLRSVFCCRKPETTICGLAKAR